MGKEIHLRTSVKADTSTPDNVQIKVNRFIWQPLGLVVVGLIFLAISLTIQFGNTGFDLKSFVEWFGDTIGSVGIEFVGAGLVLYLIFRISQISR